MSEKTTQNYIDELAARGVYHFTPASLAKARSSSVTAARSALIRLASRGIIAMPYRGFFVSVPLEYRAIGCLPADQFLPLLRPGIQWDLQTATDLVRGRLLATWP